MRNRTIKPVILASTALLGLGVQCQSEKKVAEKPNILWLVSEDNCPYLGCYGDSFATSPNLDKLASQGFTYTHCYANGPVSAAARNCIITGVYAVSGGNEHMRSSYNMSGTIRLFPSYLKEAGYYCTNNAKTDYNIARDQTGGAWDESSNRAHYKNRQPGQPFFAVFNIGNTHESALHISRPDSVLRHDPAKVELPPYHPDLPEIRHDWAQYYDVIQEMDTEIGKKLQELEESGEADNTIVIYYGDNGGILARSKRFVYETGTHVPLIIRIPEKFKKQWPAKKIGGKIDRLVSFVDLAPTVLSLAGIQIPDYMQGNAFLGYHKSEDPEYAYMFRGRMDERYDLCRAVRDKQFRYIRNFMPNRIYGQNLYYLWLAPSARAWEKAYLEGNCNEIQSIFWNEKPAEELYDTENDPWEVNNLAQDPAYKEVLGRMRMANREWMLKIKDSGLIPEAQLSELNEGVATYDYMRNGKVPLESILEAAEKATDPEAGDLSVFKSYLKSELSPIRYWGATGIMIHNDDAKNLIPDLKDLLSDQSANVVAAASEALYELGDYQACYEGLTKVLQSESSFARLHALNIIESRKINAEEIIDGVINMAKRAGKLTLDSYDHRAAKRLLDVWGINAKNNGIEITW